jgi:hypothetical protein
LIDDLGGTVTVEARNKTARDCTIAMAFLKGADPRRYTSLWTDLANQQNRGNDQYPRSLTAAYSMIVNSLGPNQARTSGNGGGQSQVSSPPPTDSIDVPPGPSKMSSHTFAQTTRNTPSSSPSAGNSVPGSEGVTHSTVTCFNYNANGHYANSCPSDVSLLQHIYALTQANAANGQLLGIPTSWILLDIQSSISVFNNPRMISNIRQSLQPFASALTVDNRSPPKSVISPTLEWYGITLTL